MKEKVFKNHQKIRQVKIEKEQKEQNDKISKLEKEQNARILELEKRVEKLEKVIETLLGKGSN